MRRSSGRELIKEILVAELGDSIYKSPYLIVSDCLEIFGLAN